MFAITEKYTDFNGIEREEVFYFNLTRAEAVEFQHSHNGGIDVMIRRVIAAHDQPELIKIMKEFMRRTYGVKSDDGRRFIKSDELWEDFTGTEAYSNIFMRLATDDKFAAEFIRGIVPKDVRDEMEKQSPDVFSNVTALSATDA